MKKLTLLVSLFFLIFHSNFSQAISRDVCLLEALKNAAADTTVQQLQASCATTNLQVTEDLAAAVIQTDDKTTTGDIKTIGARRVDRLNNQTSFITPYQRNYVLPFSYNDKVNPEPFQQLFPGAEVNNVEVKFQLSIQAEVVDDILSSFDTDTKIDLWATYTQQSWWQLYNSDQSAPFRETNYEPEVFFRWMRDKDNVGPLGFKNRVVSFGYNHQSNGRGTSLSRSWNRLFVGAEFDKGNLLIMPRIWWRIPEDTDNDDNPDLTKYVGYGDVKMAYHAGEHLFSTTLRNNLRSDNRGSIQLDWTFPFPWTKTDRFKGYVQYFNGYGESLIDYNEYSKRFSIGVTLTDWL